LDIVTASHLPRSMHVLGQPCLPDSVMDRAVSSVVRRTRRRRARGKPNRIGDLDPAFAGYLARKSPSARRRPGAGQRTSIRSGNPFAVTGHRGTPAVAGPRRAKSRAPWLRRNGARGSGPGSGGGALEHSGVQLGLCHERLRCRSMTTYSCAIGASLFVRVGVTTPVSI
jgi:hypothetical protein